MSHYFHYPGYHRKTLITLGLVLLMGCSHHELVVRGEGAPPAEKCGECHIEIYKEWEASAHARSFSSEDFREATHGYSFKFCLGCHAPESVYTEGEPGPRTSRLEEGVTCNSCHLTEDCKLAGPLKSRAPHPVGQEHKLYLESELCGKCHVRTFKEWQKAVQEDKKTCQNCHMPVVKRKLIQDEPWKRLFREKEIKRHIFSSAESASGGLASEGAIRIDLEWPDVVIENVSIPHALPTGDYGYREVVLRVRLKGSEGDGILLKEESFFVETDTSLKSGEKRVFSLSVPGGALKKDTSLTVELLRNTFQGETRMVLARREFPLGQEDHGAKEF